MSQEALAAAGVDEYRSKVALQQPEWPDKAALERVTHRLTQVPPLVFAGEADDLRDQLAAAGRAGGVIRSVLPTRDSRG